MLKPTLSALALTPVIDAPALAFISVLWSVADF